MALSTAKRSVSVLRPVSAANVSGRTNSCAASGHGRLHLVSLLHQQARQFRRFVGRNAAADAEKDLHGKKPASPAAATVRLRAPVPGARGR